MQYDMLLVGVTFAIAIIALFIAVYILIRLKKVPGVWQVGLLFVMEFVYSFGYALELAGKNLSSKMAAIHIEYIAIPFIAVTWVYVSKKFNDANYSAKLRNYIWLLIVPVIVLISVQISYYTGFDLYYESEYLETITLFGSQLLTVTLVKGPIYYLHTIQGTLLTAYVVYIYVKTFIKSKGIQKKQAFILACCAIVGTVASAIPLFSPLTAGIDTALYMIVAIGFVILYTMFKYEMFDLKPSAYLAAFEITSNPIIVLDDKYEVVSWNKAASMFSGNKIPICYHIKMRDLFFNKELIRAVKDNATFSFKIGSKHYVLEPIPLENKAKHINGYLLKFNEVTGYMQKIEKLDYQASHDELTKILNRRAFHERATHFLEEELANGVPFSMIMIDLDDFKKINDTYGHTVGDHVLSDIGALIGSALPENGLFCRYGGEEFMILLPSCDAQNSNLISESIRILVMKNTFIYEDIHIKIQISLGVYNYQSGDTGEVYDYVKLADEALYVSKRTGKNKATSFPQKRNGTDKQI